MRATFVTHTAAVRIADAAHLFRSVADILALRPVLIRPSAGAEHDSVEHPAGEEVRVQRIGISFLAGPTGAWRSGSLAAGRCLRRGR
nr:hypothetical protein [Microbispora sp. H10830]